MTALTLRQQQVAELVAQGWTDKQIAASLTISDRRVREIIARLATLWDLDTERDIRVQIAQRAA